MRIGLLALAVIAATAPAGGASAQTNERPGLRSIVEPIVPERKIGLPDQAPPPEGTDELPAPKTRAASPAANPVAPRTAAATPRRAEQGVWASECVEKAPKPNCQVIVRSIVGDQIALVIGVAKVPTNKIRMQMAVPLGLAVAKGVDVEVSGYKNVFQVSRCTAQGCLVEGEAPADFIAALNKNAETGPVGAATIYTAEGQPIKLPLPTKGFAKVFAGLK